ncbi:integral membrane protein [Verticillium alfalfae VaMs.102]|uniref:Integral membrane protein n=1 Tax=Verticillium alfalfae (strain VaMs.102 / ATCC MYA-4576 / FGSC 10136) TaxID=526221 RepID=C9SK63_VERA1|nr:integral membrane protein [Verticillium alfalfae VaMs.102]EEY19081.1 integral membrane protein [Verticillium alfalfae VaMs.102]
MSPGLSGSEAAHLRGAQKEHESFLSSLNHTILTGFELRRFPAFCALLAGGSTLLESRICSKFTKTVPTRTNVHPGVKEEKVAMAGRTLDMTLFAFTRALESLVGYSTDPWIFVCSCALIMWAWFYNPSGLPKAYQRWISSAAAVDNRLIEALRRCRSGDLRYGKDTGQAPLLQSMCEDYKWPVIWGDPAKTAPFPCEMVHMGCGPSCEYHALSRLVRSWRWSMAMYLPLNLAMQLRKPPTVRGIRTAVLSASRSSAFLGVFIMLFYYGVCLGRTRIGPHIVGKDFAGRQKIDGGVCVGCGCFMCGWSVLLETASRRKDMALFVAPRALATLFPRRYAEDKQWRETLTFAASAAVVFTCAKENPARVRGVFGKLLGSVLRV